DEVLGFAYAGLGLVMEYFGHLVLQHASQESIVPVQLTDVHVGYNGSGGRGREIVSVDISEYMDPLHCRHVRLPFSAYLKAQRNREAVGAHVVDALPPIFQIPFFEMS